MYYENFKKLCETYKATPYAVSKATGIPSATLTAWKKGEYTPKLDKIGAIAEFFGVPIEYLTGDEPARIEVDKAQLLEHAFDDRPEMRTLFQLAKDAPVEDIEYVIKKLEALRDK